MFSYFDILLRMSFFFGGSFFNSFLELKINLGWVDGFKNLYDIHKDLYGEGIIFLEFFKSYEFLLNS